ncbi:hypothetical protein ACCO45_013601 [Purpureocillium lilacinum]|uniref:Uncharacterized protein n=1 Tax=Purpureocillium lilacinum TaxID=33203 RepID=A0ACC4D8E4_PURLI
MSVVSLLGVKVLNNPAKFTDKYEFEITFECLEALEKDLEWKLTYVGSATSDQYDQELDSLLVGPVPVGVNKFIFEADAPSTSRIPDADILGVTVILLTCAYDGREAPAKPIVERVKRNVLAEKPRVTRFAIKWYVARRAGEPTEADRWTTRDSEASAPAEFPPEQPEADLVADGEEYGAEEAEEEAAEEEAAEDAGEAKVAGDDAEMAGVEQEQANGHENGQEEDEMSEDGSVDIEGESEDELEEEEGEGRGRGRGRRGRRHGGRRGGEAGRRGRFQACFGRLVVGCRLHQGEEGWPTLADGVPRRVGSAELMPRMAFHGIASGRLSLRVTRTTKDDDIQGGRVAWSGKGYDAFEYSIF